MRITAKLAAIALILMGLSGCVVEEVETVVVEQESNIKAAAYDYAYIYDYLSEDYKQIYRELYSGIISQNSKINVSAILDAEKFKEVYGLMVTQEPQFYNIANSMEYTVLVKNNMVNGVNIDYLYSMDDFIIKNMAIEEAVIDVVRDCTDKTDKEKVNYIHRRIIEKTLYVESGFDADNIVGVLYDTSATCMGYAKTFKYLCDKVGLNCIVVTGEANGGHMWNMVQVDGEWLAIDCTWDDPDYDDKSIVYYDYYLLPLEEMNKTHKLDEFYKNLINKIETEDNYVSESSRY